MSQLTPLNDHPDDDAHGMPLMSAMSAMNSDTNVEDELAGFNSDREQKAIAMQSAILIAIVAVVASGILFGMKLGKGGAVQATDSTNMAKIDKFLLKTENPDLVDESDALHPRNVEKLLDRSRIVQELTQDFAEKGVPLDQLQKNPFAREIAPEEEAAVVDNSEQEREQRMAELFEEMNRLDLSSIMGSGRRSIAVIGDKFYRIGDKVGPFRLANIAPGKVLLMPTEFERRDTDAPFILRIVEKVDAQRY